MKCKMKIDKIMFPRGATVTTAGDFAIFTAIPLKVLDNEAPKVSKTYGTVTLKGKVPSIKPNMIFNITFGKEEENNYGVSYWISDMSIEFNPKDKKELLNYLKVVTSPSLAKELIKLDNVYELLTNRVDEELLKVKGIGITTLEKIYTNIDSYQDKSFAYTKLEPLGLSKNLIERICLSVGGSVSAVEMCFTDPYGLIKKVKGIGFILADEIAQRCGVADKDRRTESAILHTLEVAGESGKSFLSQNQLLFELSKIIDTDFETINKKILDLCTIGEVATNENGDMVALLKYLKLERSLALRVVELLRAKSKIETPNNYKEIIKSIEEEQGWNYTDEQYLGIEMALYNNILLVTGLAGTGKSTISNAICKILENYEIEMCCLSAKASQRLTEVTGLEAKTIHRLLQIGVNLEKEVDKIYADIVIVDEATMINGTLFLKLLKAVERGTKLIISGDIGQLTAIGDCSVFSDLIMSGVVPHINLTKIHRQASKSEIIKKSMLVREQKPIYESGFIGEKLIGGLQDLFLSIHEENEFLLSRAVELYKFELEKGIDINELQIITTNKTRGKVCTKEINLKIQELIIDKNKKSFFGKDRVEIFEGDKVINLKNDYKCKTENDEIRAIYNGSIGRVVKIEDEKVIVDFIGLGEVVVGSLQNIDLAYAITIHSSQGSQWEVVIVVLDTSGFLLLNVETLYTALTRARTKVDLVATSKAIKIALSNVEQKTKQTLLSGFLTNSVK